VPTTAVERPCGSRPVLQQGPDGRDEQAADGPADRLAQIESDLNDRIDTAREQSWLGDVEQLQLTLSHLHDKQDQVQRLLNIISVPRLITAAPTLSTSST
jgi:hypothetical protein